MAQEHAGQSLVDMLWEQLDAQYNRLKELHAESGGFTVADLQAMLEDGTGDGEKLSQEIVEYLQQQGKVQGLCFAVGTIMYPYDPPKDRIEKVRAELPQRWADTYGEEEEDD